MKIRTLIVDDEAEAREGGRLLLQKDADIALVGMCKNGLEAIQMIKEEKPDLVLLDIQMPEINGFEVLSSLVENSMPTVIFITAYDQYALKAFEIHAVDYLLKPFTDERFFQALNYAKQHINSTSLNSVHQKLHNLIDSYQAQIPEQTDHLVQEVNLRSERLIIKSSGKIVFMQLPEIIWIEAYDYYIKIHLKDKTYLVRESMKRMNEKLPAKQFVRIHKSSIVNLQYVRELEPYQNGEYFVHLSTGQKLKLSRSYRELVDWLIG